MKNEGTKDGKPAQRPRICTTLSREFF